MRNVLVFPDGSKHDFMYPTDRDIDIGSPFQVQMKDDSIRVLRVKSIEKTEKAIYYYLEQT